MKKSLISEVKRNGVGYMVLVAQVPYLELRVLLETLEVEGKTFLMDLVYYFLEEGGGDNPFINTIMECPITHSGESTDPFKDEQHTLKILTQWVDHTELSEFKEIVRSEQVIAGREGLSIRPTNAALERNFAVVELEVSTNEVTR